MIFTYTRSKAGVKNNQLIRMFTVSFFLFPYQKFYYSQINDQMYFIINNGNFILVFRSSKTINYFTSTGTNKKILLFYVLSMYYCNCRYCFLASPLRTLNGKIILIIKNGRIF